MTPKEILIAARAKIEAPERWTKGRFARAKNGACIGPQTAGAMPEGWRIGHMTQDEDSFCVEAYREEPDNFASAEAPDEPRARTAAALRAMAAEVGA